MNDTTRYLGPMGAGSGDDERQMLAWLDQLLELPVGEREAALLRLGLSPAQERRLRHLLGNHALTDQFLEAPDVPAPVSRSALPQDGERIGIYRIERPISAGGMGIVYLAQRDDGLYQQRVAIKLVQPSHLLMDPARRHGLLTRFEEERAILAQLQHPNIVRILDGGQTEQGLPYLVMDFVDGVDLMQFCRERRLDVPARLGLFCQVCDAVQEAHRHLIVHRDIKPGNVLVDANSLPHLLDFGIAKLLDPLRSDEADGQTQATVLGAMTPAYASPEQLRRRPLTTRSDIYSLGVMLYQMLTGKRPYDTDDLSPAEIERAVCTTEPPPLSRVLHDDDADPGYAQMPRSLPQDLERIVAKALHKEPARRYGSAQELADDLRRHLAGLPVLAQPDTWSYRLGKLLGRHRLASALVGAALALILTASALALYQAREARQAASDMSEVNTFLTDVLAFSDPHVAGGVPTLGEAVDAAVVYLDKRFPDRPEITAEIRHVLGVSQLARGQLEAAESLLAKSLEESLAVNGSQHRLTFQIRRSQAQLASSQRRDDDATEMLQALLDDVEAAGFKAHPIHFLVLNDFATVQIRREAHREAWQLLEAAAGLPASVTDALPADSLAMLRGNQANVAHSLGRLEESMRLYEEAEALHLAAYPDGSPELWTTMSNRSFLLEEMGKADEAYALRKTLLERQRERMGERDPLVVAKIHALMFSALNQGDTDFAVSLAKEAASISREGLPQPHPDTLVADAVLARILITAGRLDDAATALARFQADLVTFDPQPDGMPDALKNLQGKLCEAQAAQGGPACAP